jgi:hypothetical protein
MAEESDSFDQMIRGLRDGDSRCAEEFWQQYGESLQRVADKRLPKGCGTGRRHSRYIRRSLRWSATDWCSKRPTGR